MADMTTNLDASERFQLPDEEDDTAAGDQPDLRPCSAHFFLLMWHT